MVAGARACRRPRRLRLPEPEDPREGDAGRPPGGRRPAALRPHRHGQLPLDHCAAVRGLRPLHRRPGDRRGRREPLQLRHRLRQPEEFRKLLVAPFNLRDRLIEEIRKVAQAAASKKNARIRLEGEQPQRPGDHRRALPRLAGGREDRPDRAERLHPPAGGEGAEREHPRAQRARPLPRAQPRLPLRGARRPARTSSGAPTSCRGTSTTASRRSRPSRTRGSSTASARRSTRCSRTRPRGSCSPDGTWKRSVVPKKGEQPRSGQAVLMRSARRRRRSPSAIT